MALVTGLALIPAGGASATTNCSFTIAGTTMTLDGNCTTDSTIVVPDGYTLDGAGYTITAVDPSGGHFVGAVVANGGIVAHVTDVTVAASGLVNICDSGANRLRGIMFDSASGSITKTTVTGINQGPSGCQEGNAIEVRNAPYDGTHPAPLSVLVKGNDISAYQKTGIVANGDVDVTIANNVVGASATQANLAANSIQMGFGAMGTVTHNVVYGNQWLGVSDWAATAILVYAADGITISQNRIAGNSEIGIYFYADDGTIDNNKVFDKGVDSATHDYDIGIGNYGDGNIFTNNKVNGFDDAYVGVDDIGTNKEIGQPSA
ncbi:MAG: right-handed parallel beta-helix repeat-containing protein [Actinomycetota bacterium]